MLWLLAPVLWDHWFFAGDGVIGIAVWGDRVPQLWVGCRVAVVSASMTYRTKFQAALLLLATSSSLGCHCG